MERICRRTTFLDIFQLVWLLICGCFAPLFKINASDKNETQGIVISEKGTLAWKHLGEHRKSKVSRETWSSWPSWSRLRQRGRRLGLAQLSDLAYRPLYDPNSVDLKTHLKMLLFILWSSSNNGDPPTPHLPPASPNPDLLLKRAANPKVPPELTLPSSCPG